MRIGWQARIAGIAALVAEAAAAQAPPPPPDQPPAPAKSPAALVPPRGTVLPPPDTERADCATPGPVNGRTFYVDPTTGNGASDGSAARPWRTLAEVMTSPAARDLRAGDTLMLLSGDHGAVTVTGRNSGFVSVRAAPGAAPRLQSLMVLGASNWAFDRLTIAGERDGYAALVTINPGKTGTTENIVLTNSLLTSADDTAGWTQDEWVRRARWVAIRADAGRDRGAVRCLAFAHNHVTNVLFGVVIAADNSRFTDNVIDRFGADGLDLAASYLTVARNRITDNVDVGIGNHNDAIQLQAGRFRSYRDVVIDGNTIIRQTQSDTPFPSYLQGISAFNVDWFDVTVTNNVVITNAGHGISFGSIHGGLFANNIVLNDDAEKPNFGDTWLKISPRTHEGFDTADVVVRNNIAWTLGTVAAGDGIAFADNISGTAALPVAGKTMWFKAAGAAAGGNRVNRSLAALFVDYAPRAYRFDLRPAKPGDARNWPDRLMAITGGPADAPQPGISDPQ